MRNGTEQVIVKLAIWDLDETILTGILEEGDEEVAPAAEQALNDLHDRGTLQALCTQNAADLIADAATRFGWTAMFVRTEADLGPKAEKIRHVLQEIDVHPSEAVFVDDDPFERASIRAQIPNLTAWSVAELTDYLKGDMPAVTEEAKRRTQLYLHQQQREAAEAAAASYEDFLRSCDIRITVRPSRPDDALRVKELLTRTHRMNLGVLPVAEAIRRLERGNHRVVIATMRDVYSDMGRCGVVHVAPGDDGNGLIESLAISCRTRGRGLALAMLTGLLRHPSVAFPSWACRYRSSGRNRPLRMLLMAAGFRPVPDSDLLRLDAEHLMRMDLPDWIDLSYEETNVAAT